MWRAVVLESSRGTAGRIAALATAAVVAAVFVVAGILPVGARAAEPRTAEIHFPPERALVKERYLTVEGLVRSSTEDEVEIIVNDSDTYRARVRRFLFSEEVRLQEGENTIRVGSTVRRVAYVAKGVAPPGFSRMFGHFGLGDGCAECHTFGKAGQLTLAAPREEICGWCHYDMIAGPQGKRFTSVHAPVKAGKCLLCHVAHTSTNPQLLRDKVPGCSECHAPVFERLKKDRFVHGPLNLGDCRLCHAMHGSTEPGLLIRPATSLCTDCHSDVFPPAGTPAALAPHRMIPEGACAKCHFPHSSNNTHLMRLPAGRLCQECHPENTKSFHEAKGFSIYICAKCHELHRPSMPHLIIEASRSLCTQCHAQAEKLASGHTAARDGRCFICHSFHKTALTANIALLCLSCHPRDPALLAAHAGVAFDKSRCTSCHLPHESPGAKLLLPVAHTPFARRECWRCHRTGEPAPRQPLRGTCLKCHVDLDLERVKNTPTQVHQPFANDDCAVCHTSHAASNAGLINEPPLQLCLKCHRVLRKAMLLRPKSSHGAFLKGKCLDCHTPHFSQSAGLLREPLPELCPKCHSGITGPPGQPRQKLHPPVAQGQCDLCHRPHNSALPSLLRPAAQRGCPSCHEQFYAAFKSPDSVSRHAPVKDDLCDICHQLHGSTGGGLLRPGAERDGCQNCHSDWKNLHHRFTPEQLAEKAGGESANARGCLYCHRPHASTERKLLQPAHSRACVGCHKK